MNEEIENQEIEIEDNHQEELESGLYGYTVNYNIYKLLAEDFTGAIDVIKNLGLLKDHYLIEKSQGILLITEEILETDNKNILEKLQ